MPTGGASVSASTGAQSSPVTVTVPAGSYYLTQAGGVSSLLTTLQTQLEENVQPYPATASAMQAVVGSGTWTAGWLMNEASGALAAAFGAPSLSATSSPTYGIAGPKGGIDKAVGFDSASDAFDGGDVFDVTGTDDLVIAWVGKFTASSSGNVELFAKYQAANPRWIMYRNGSNNLIFNVNDSVDNVDATIVNVTSGSWYVGIAVLDRTNNQSRIGIRTLDSGTTTVSSIANTAAVGTIANSGNFTIGNAGLFGADTAFQCAAAYIATGVGAAGSLVANLSTALSNFASAVTATWSVSMSSTTGRVTILNSHWPASVSFTSTALRDVLGFEYDFDYPQTAAQMATALGYGTWTSGAGYLCNEASGNLAAVFGSPAFTPANTPTYGNQGPRGGTDKAVGFDSSSDTFVGADVFDVGAADDAIFVWVAKLGTLAGGQFHRIVIKSPFANGHYVIYSLGSTVYLEGTDTSGNPFLATAASATHFEEWHVGVAVIDRSTGKARVATQGLRTGTQAISSEASMAAVASLANSANFTLGSYTDGSWQLAAMYVVTGSGVATGLSANLSTALSNFAAYMKSQTGTGCARGIWIPDSPLNCDDHPSMAPEDTDVRMSEGPTGVVLGLSGNKKYVHTNVTWQRVPVSQIREEEATYPNGSLEVFFRDAISGLGGHEWMGPASPLQIYWSNAGTDVLLGGDANDGEGAAGWSVVGVRKFSDIAKPSQRGWVGQFDVVFPRLVSTT